MRNIFPIVDDGDDDVLDDDAEDKEEEEKNVSSRTCSSSENDPTPLSGMSSPASSAPSADPFVREEEKVEE
jgi:hypothetical protein